MMASPSQISETESWETSFAGVQDYLTIGLRPMEYRLPVIRRAMYRSALPLAALHLDHPDRAVERKLARVLATGYRLLDPRRREDSIQRMMLGRIHPQFADEVIRIAHARGNQLVAFEPVEQSEIETFEPRGLYQDPLRSQGGQAGLANPLYLADDGTSPWSESLRSPDLLIEHPWKRALRSSRRWVSQRCIAAGAAVGGALVVLNTWRQLQPVTRPRGRAVQR